MTKAIQLCIICELISLKENKVDFIAISLTGFALAMDAFAVTIANCTAYKNKLTKTKEWSMPIAFALFQFLMPVIGFYIGSTFCEYIINYAGYITASVFLLLAVKVIFDSVKELTKKNKEIQIKNTEFNYIVLLIQAVSTSIDALIIGVTYSTHMQNPFVPALIIGAITFILVSCALLFGKYLGKIFNKYASWIGAVILFALAVKTLVTTIIG